MAPRTSGPVFKFCSRRLIFGGTEGVGSRFHVLYSRTRFRRYRRRRLLFSCFSRPDTFSAVPRVLGPVFKYWGRSDMFFKIPKVSGPILMFCSPRVVSRGTEGVGSCFQVLHSQTNFWKYRGHQIPFSCFALPDSFSMIPRASVPILMFCAPELIFGGTEGVSSRF
jgi:hypothetical protein